MEDENEASSSVWSPQTSRDNYTTTSTAVSSSVIWAAPAAQNSYISTSTTQPTSATAWSTTSEQNAIYITESNTPATTVTVWSGSSQSESYESASSTSVTTPTPVVYNTENNIPVEYANAAQYEQIGQQYQYQLAAAHEGMYHQSDQSSYERISPVEEYRHVTSASENMAGYSSLTVAQSSLISPSVDSSMHPAAYQIQQVLLGNDHRLVSLQRVQPTEPVNDLVVMDAHADSVDSGQQPNKSFVPLACHSQQYASSPSSSSAHSSTLHALASSSQATNSIPIVPIHSLASSSQATNSIPIVPIHTLASSSQATNSLPIVYSSEVTTTDRSRMMTHMESYPECHHARLDDGMPAHSQKSTDDMGASSEPDTTQRDSPTDFRSQQHMLGRSYRHQASIPNEVSPDSITLHSTMNGQSITSTCVISGPSIASTGLLTGQPINTVGVLNQPISTSGVLNAQDIIGSNFDTSHLHQDPDNSVDINDSGVVLATVPGEAVADSSLDVNSIAMTMFLDAEGNEPGVSTEQRKLRKSDRLASIHADTGTWIRPEYIPKPYNPNEIWCEECMATYSAECPTHRLQMIQDRVVFSRAWASLPPLLQIYRFGDTSELGVFAKRSISKLTQFGPFIGDLVDSQDKLRNPPKFLVLLDKPDDTVAYFDTSEENKCNWMMFVRPAQSFCEQNLVAYQHGQDIYFSVIKHIEAKQELKVWYSAPYADRIGVGVHEVTDQDIEAMDDLVSKWACYECNKKFKTSSALQKHLLIHEDGAPMKTEDDEYDDRKGLRKSKRKGTPLRSSLTGLLKRRAQAARKTDLGDTAGYQWKKKSTSIYLNRHLKKYQRRHNPEVIRRTIQSLYRKKGKDSGGNEWLCIHCDLTFDNANLLNLHTLTHAAEDVGLEEIRKFACDLSSPSQTENAQVASENGDGTVALESCHLACPVCHMQFTNKRDLIDHASEHGKAKSKVSIPPYKPHRCDHCGKCFSTNERLQKHLLCHGSEESKPLQCQVCLKRFMNNSALACHMKKHSDRKYYDCPICHLDFDHITALKEHVVMHALDDGKFPCIDCQRVFADFKTIRKHMRNFHSDKTYPCMHCDKVLPRPDKLKLHMLKHTSLREFMCETCGRQFKRKDKLKEHIKRMHTGARELSLDVPSTPSNKKFVPKVSPNDYHRFIYKCHQCLLGFKRRGMLVNHLAKRHPDIKPDSVPELNLPILKTQRDFYCQYCEKVYKSSSKRKSHILKNHPGLDLPLSSRKKSQTTEVPGIPNPTFSHTVGSVTMMPHSCVYCHKQYASKAKLTQHQRRKHPEAVAPLPEKQQLKSERLMQQLTSVALPQQQQVQPGMERYEAEMVQVTATEGMPTADLLTQAMSELTQSLGEYHIPPGTRLLHTNSGAMVQVQAAPPHLQHSTIELSHLGQTLAHTQFAQHAHLIQVAAAGTPPQQQQQVPQPISPQPNTVATPTPQQQPITLSITPQPQQQAQPIALSITTQQQQVQPIAMSITPSHPAYGQQRSWNNYQTYR